MPGGAWRVQKGQNMKKHVPNWGSNLKENCPNIASATDHYIHTILAVISSGSVLVCSGGYFGVAQRGHACPAVNTLWWPFWFGFVLGILRIAAEVSASRCLTASTPPLVPASLKRAAGATKHARIWHGRVQAAAKYHWDAFGGPGFAQDSLLKVAWIGFPRTGGV